MNEIILIYELKNRELDNALLLKCELEERGYIVKIKEKTTNFHILKKEKVLIVPNMYNSENYKYYTYRFNAFNIPVINLQYEQICSMNKKSDEFYSVEGSAKQALHLCWGRVAFNRLKNNNISKQNISITGAMHLDFLRKEFCSYWETREELAKKFDISNNSLWILYISGFAFADNPYVESSVIEELGDHYKNIGEFHKRNRINILIWFEKILEEKNDVVVVYRPHPMEWDLKELDRLLMIYKGRFIVVSDLNIKQWILVSDIVTTWYSTSIAECFVSGKNIFLLRPEIIPSNFDAEIYKNCNSINKYEKFAEIVKNKLQGIGMDEEFPIKISKIQEYYDLEDDIPSYIKIADQICEQLNKEKKPFKSKEKIIWNYNRWTYIIKEHVIIKLIFKKLYKKLYKKIHISIKSIKLRNKYALNIWEKEAIENEKNLLEINEKIFKIKKIVKNNRIKFHLD